MDKTLREELDALDDEAFYARVAEIRSQSAENRCKATGIEGGGQWKRCSLTIDHEGLHDFRPTTDSADAPKGEIMETKIETDQLVGLLQDIGKLLLTHCKPCRGTGHFTDGSMGGTHSGRVIGTCPHCLPLRNRLDAQQGA